MATPLIMLLLMRHYQSSHKPTLERFLLRKLLTEALAAAIAFLLVFGGIALVYLYLFPWLFSR